MYQIDLKNSIEKFLCVLLFIISLNIAAQEDSFAPSFTPPSPAAASLGSYGNVPIGMSTGSPNVNLDIYTLSENGISIPISLGYSSNGVAVDATSKQLGIDWNLLVGGVVSRQVNGADDLTMMWTTPNEERLCIPSEVDPIDLYANPPQKDIFNYSAPGISGKFILDGNSIRELNISDNKIEIIFVDGVGGSRDRVFKITSVDGTEYYFGEGAARERSTNISYCGGAPSPSGQYDTAWLLTKIKKVTGQEANFTYISQSFTSTNYQQLGKSIITQMTFPSGASIGTPCYSNEFHNSFFVESIVLNDKKVTFEYEELETYYLYKESKQLKKIKIYSGVNTLLKSFDFNYLSVLPNSNSYGLNTNTKTDKKRFFLKEVLERNKLESKTHQKYSFEYYNPEGLPPRNSFSKDIYGYYNAKNNKNMVYNNLGPNNTFYQVFKDANTADRNANSSVVHYGMLKSITYPTKGKTEFVYEPNAIYVKKTFYPAPVTFSIGAEAGPVKSDVRTEFELPFSQLVTLYGEAQISYMGEGLCREDIYPNKTPSCNVSIIDFNTGEVKGYLSSDVNKTVQFQLDAGKYYLRVYTIIQCLDSYGSVKFFPTPPEDRMVNDPVAGVRVKRTLDYDENGNVTTKRYYYTDPKYLSSTMTEYPSDAEFAIRNPDSETNLDKFETEKSSIYTMFSNSKVPLYSFDGPTLSYHSVIESFGENFENGGIMHFFKTRSDGMPVVLCDEYIRGTPYTNGFMGGTEYKTITFRKEGQTIINLEKEEFDYYHDVLRDFEVNNYTSHMHKIHTSSSHTPVTDRFYSFNVYQIRSQRHFLKQKKSTKYDFNGLNPLVTIVDYKYDSPNHLQLSSEEVTNSEKEKVETKYLYAKDAVLSGVPFVNDLKIKNMVGIPLNIQTIKGSKVFEKLTLYDKSASTSNLLLPKAVYTAKFPNSLPVVSGIGNLEKKITYDIYDEKGNVVQYTIENGMPVAIIWGYNKTQPLAKIENATYSQVQSYVVNLQRFSDLNDEVNLMAALNSLRTAIPDAFVTTYTYVPLVGVASITDPKGIATFYTYDDFGRLSFVKDQNLNVLEKYCYNYKGEFTDCNPIYSNVVKQAFFSRNCGSGTATPLLYKVEAGTYKSLISQADADGEAEKDLANNGQAYVDSNGVCTFSNVSKSQVFTRNNCAAGGTPGTSMYTVPAGTYKSFISQADADAQAQKDINDKGMAYANANASCTFYNAARSGEFTKSDCGKAPIRGSVVRYDQIAGIMSSTISQADVDAKAQQQFIIDGQANANKKGGCFFYNNAKSGAFIKNNCPAGSYSDVPIIYTYEANQYISEFSQADADQQAQAYVDAYGQANANQKGSCKNIVFGATETFIPIGRKLEVILEASHPNHNGRTFNLVIMYDTFSKTGNIKTEVHSLSAGQTLKKISISLPASTTYAQLNSF